MNFCRRIIPIFIVRSNYYTINNTFSKNRITSIVDTKTRKFYLCAKVFYSKDIMETQNISKDEIKKRLTPLQYHVTQEKGTERPFSGKFNKTYDKGMYSCVVCGQELFSSDTKYDSGCGWPAFNDVLDKGLVKLSKDTSNVGANILLLIAKPGTIRTEVQCAKCDAHLGHVFDDGPKPTGKRFCINSASLDFKPASSDK